MGKNFTSASKEDNVYTPFSMVNQLLENEKFDYSKTFLEPCEGEGNITYILAKHKCNVLNSGDIKYGYDFLKGEKEPHNYIITNPPYSKLNQFIVKAKQVATEKFAFLCKITHLVGVDRFESQLFRDPNYPLTKIYMFTRQANLRFFDKKEELKAMNNAMQNPEELNPIKYCKKIKEIEKMIDYPELREDGRYPAGMYYYVWLIWEKMPNVRFAHPNFRWINNQKYILSKKDKE